MTPCSPRTPRTALAVDLADRVFGEPLCPAHVARQLRGDAACWTLYYLDEGLGRVDDGARALSRRYDDGVRRTASLSLRQWMISGALFHAQELTSVAWQRSHAAWKAATERYRYEHCPLGSQVGAVA